VGDWGGVSDVRAVDRTRNANSEARSQKARMARACGLSHESVSGLSRGPVDELKADIAGGVHPLCERVAWLQLEPGLKAKSLDFGSKSRLFK
jgi:hypothetical protein